MQSLHVLNLEFSTPEGMMAKHSIFGTNEEWQTQKWSMFVWFESRCSSGRWPIGRRLHIQLNRIEDRFFKRSVIKLENALQVS